MALQDKIKDKLGGMIKKISQPGTDVTAESILAWGAREFPGKIALASSLGMEDQVLTHMIAVGQLPINIFTLDTGKLFPETYELLERTKKQYGLSIRVYSPDPADVARQVEQLGENAHRVSIECRRACCQLRKMEPLRRALAGLQAWICGLRRDQAVTRKALEIVEWDEGNGLVKICPLADWTEEQLRSYVKENNVPYNPLHDQNFPSIGCACCTRAVRPGEDIRAGRWWWEKPEHKECGLHARHGK